MEHLFISYSRRDEKYVSAVAEGLRSRGIEVWQDISGKASGIPYSTKWFEVIQEALFSSAGAVIFTSDQWEKSDPCKKEFELIRALDIPYKMVSVPAEEADSPAAEERLSAEEAGPPAAEEHLSAEEAGPPAAEERLSAEEAAEMIAEWSAQEVYGNAANMDRVWMLSMIWNQRTKYGALAGIPYFRKRKDSKEFLERLERCRAISEEKGFPERLEKCRVIVTDDAEQESSEQERSEQERSEQERSGQQQAQKTEKSDEVERFLKKARRRTITGLIMRPLIVAVIVLLIAGSVAVNWGYSVQRDRSRQHLQALTIMEQIRALMNSDEKQALAAMGREDLEFGEYVTLLYEVYAQILSREFPAEVLAADTDEAKNISSIPEQKSADGYTVELSDTSGVARVYTEVKEDGSRRMLALSVSDKPQDWAAQDGYLALAAGKNAYVHDLQHGNAVIMLYGCDGEIEKICFDEEGRICAVTDSGKVCIWENPIRRVICSAHEAPQLPSDNQPATEQIAKNKKLRVTGSAEGLIQAYDTSRNCLIWQCTSVTEPITNLLLEEDTWTVYALGRSGAWYKIDASGALAEYDSKDVAGQRARFREAGDRLVAAE